MPPSPPSTLMALQRRKLRQAAVRLAWVTCCWLAAAAMALLAVAGQHAFSADAPSSSPPGAVPARFAPAQVTLGAQLAAVGNCAGCHTLDDAKPLAGGRPLQTPFGTVYATNITPDAATGLGDWNEADFRRAMREGISRDGHKLYPAFPYAYFTRLSDADIAALYAYVMTREPIAQATPANTLVFPINFRPLIAVWNLLYLDKRPYQPDATKSAEWNRGAYLTTALGHCGACHSPRNALGAEKKDQYLDGGDAEGWHAPGLDDAHSPSPQPWTVPQLAAYLRHGIADNHAIAAGPMQAVVTGLAQASDADITALATYIQAQQSPPSLLQQSREANSLQRARAGPLGTQQAGTPLTGAPGEERQLRMGAWVYAHTCARCHDAGRERGAGGSAGALQLPLAVAVYEPDPASLVRIVLQGVPPPPGQSGRWMPGYAAELDDEQLTALLTYLRRQATDLPPWPQLAQAIAQARASSSTTARK